MIIGIVTTWFERGAAYVSRIYMELLQSEGHEVYIFARGGENFSETISEKWNGLNVTRSLRYRDSTIEKHKMKKWIKNRKIETIFFNEQNDFRILIWLKKNFPKVKIGAYVDYYTERTIPWFKLYDFLICNTKRHMQAMSGHPQKFYVRWGTDISLYRPSGVRHDMVTFFHSAGMSLRKGTDILIKAFIEGNVYKQSKLVIHTQIPIERHSSFTKEELAKYNIEVIEKTVTAPGLYYMGDIYVYPTRLDGLGLTMYEALASGMPLISSDFPPMNEIGTDDFVKRIRIDDFYCRGDAYFFPLVKCDEMDLITAMMWYVEHPEEIEKQKFMARSYAEEYFDIKAQSKLISKIFRDAEVRILDDDLAGKVRLSYLKNGNIFKSLLKYRAIYALIYGNGKNES